jgi:drug/metabolite transporter (DMT)-like permease
MPAAAQLVSVLFALGAFLSWGISDFVGGYTARRFNSFYLAALGHFSGTVLMVALALANHEPIPSLIHLRWAFAAGVCGGVALAFGIFTEGLPKALAIAGFGFALVGIWLVSRPDDGRRPEGLALAMISGVGFALFFIFVKQAGIGSALWIAAGSRGASLVATGLITLVGRKFKPAYPAGFGLGLLAGCIDVTGTFLFVRASQMGRLDTAVILSSLYPALTVILARIFLGEHFTRWRTVGMIAALVAVPMIASG